MNPWDITKLKLKRYSHFDAPLRLEDIEDLVESPRKVAEHKFHPFLYFEEKFQPFRPAGKTKKIRPIRYASRSDSYIFSRYRHKLAVKYEQELVNNGLCESVIAYRNIPISEGSTSGKSNIEFAKEAFDLVREIGNCVVVTADISSYFDSIDHAKLKYTWKTLLGVDELPNDHYAVFKNLTKYRDVDYKELCRALGFFGKKKTRWKERDGYLVSKKNIPIQICSNEKFRAIAEEFKTKGQNLIRKNSKPYGIPQGAPMSDLLANAYLLEFDKAVAEYANTRGGHYFRYSDDLVLILPGSKAKIARNTQKFLIKEISKTGPQIVIQPSKCASLLYCASDGIQTFKPLDKTTVLKKNGKPKRHKKGKLKGKKKKTLKMRNGFEYLGFRYDGSQVYLRDKTVSKFYRKLKRNAWAAAYSSVCRYPDKSAEELIDSFNFSEFFQKFGRVKDFGKPSSNSFVDPFKSWTFYTYAKRASKAFGEPGSPILKQISKFRKKLEADIEYKITRVHSMRTETIND